MARYRNYEHLMARHERDLRIKRLSKLILYVLIIVILICTFLGVYIIRHKKQQAPTSPKVALSLKLKAESLKLNSWIWTWEPVTRNL